MNRTVLMAVLCAAALVGCRRPPAPVVEVVPVAPGGVGVLLPSASTVPSGASIAATPSGALTFESIAGTYRGESELIRDGGRCPRGGRVAFTMRDTAVRWRVDRSVPELVAPVALDGFFMADNGPSVIRGRFSPGRLEFDAGTVRCGYRYALAKQ